MKQSYKERLADWQTNPLVTDAHLVYLATNTDSIFPEWLPLVELIRRAKLRPIDWGTYK